MGKQYGFLFDVDRCIFCHACEVACKSTRNVEAGVNWRQVIEIWSGKFPDVTRTFIALSCLHCAEPACAEVCPTGAIAKRDEDGIVVVDKEKCTGCQACFDACPYGVPQFGSDGTMQKCDFCLERGIKPACTEICPADALFFGTMEELEELAAEKKAERLDGATGPAMFIRNERGATIAPSDLVIKEK
jgi:DMSO reductase iron-sulfur subunit